jgi:hypothetical protein
MRRIIATVTLGLRLPTGAAWAFQFGTITGDEEHWDDPPLAVHRELKLRFGKV